MLRHRTQVISGKKTSIALGRVFGDAIDRISNGNWRRWILNAIKDKREDIERETHLKGLLLDGAMRDEFSG